MYVLELSVLVLMILLSLKMFYDVFFVGHNLFLANDVRCAIW